MLWLAMTLKLVTEVALMAMLGQWVLAHWPGVVPGVNPFWRLLDWISAPFVRWAKGTGRSIPCIVENGTPETFKTSLAYLARLQETA